MSDGDAVVDISIDRHEVPRSVTSAFHGLLATCDAYPAERGIGCGGRGTGNGKDVGRQICRGRSRPPLGRGESCRNADAGGSDNEPVHVCSDKLLSLQLFQAQLAVWQEFTVRELGQQALKIRYRFSLLIGSSQAFRQIEVHPVPERETGVV